MMAYARSPEGRAKIANAKAEIAAGQGIAVDSAYFDDPDRRIAARVAKHRSAGEWDAGFWRPPSAGRLKRVPVNLPIAGAG